MPVREAVVLAAGLGLRMRPLTLETPKPALPFLNRPLLQWILAGLEEAGVQRAFVNLHHLPQAVRDAAGRPARLQVRFSHEPQILGTAGVFAPLRGLLKSPCFLVANGDTFQAPDYAALEAELLRYPDCLAVLALRPGGPRYTGVQLSQEGRITGFGRGDVMFAGAYAARTELLEHLPGEGPRDLVPDLLRPLLPSGSIRGLITSGPWEDLGEPRSYLEASLRYVQEAAAGRFPVPDESTVETRDGWPVLRHTSAWLSRDATVLGPVVLGPGVRVEERAHLGRVLLLPGAAVGRQERLEGAIRTPTLTVSLPPLDS